MGRRDEPNASYYSARYAERKRAADRARDAAPRKAEPCMACGVLIPPERMRIRCDVCVERWTQIAITRGIDAADAWQREHRKHAPFCALHSEHDGHCHDGKL